MKITPFILLLTMLSMAGVYQPMTAATLDLPQYGFEIEALDASASTSLVQAVVMFLPPVDAIAPNVNVQIQPHDGDIKQYIDLSKDQFDQMQWQIISETQKGDNEWIIEYSGLFQGASMHWYARAVLHQQKVYLVTATGSESNWEAVAGQLKKCVDSFKIK